MEITLDDEVIVPSGKYIRLVVWITYDLTTEAEISIRSGPGTQSILSGPGGSTGLSTTAVFDIIGPRISNTIIKEI